MLFDSPSPCALLHPRLQSVQPKMRVFVARRGWLAGSQAKPTARAFLCVGASSALDSSGQQASLLYFRALFNGRVGRPSAPAVKETDCFPTCRVLRRCASKNVLCWLCLSLRMAMSLLLQPADPLSRLPSDRTHGEAACCCEACVAFAVLKCRQPSLRSHAGARPARTGLWRAGAWRSLSSSASSAWTPNPFAAVIDAS